MTHDYQKAYEVFKETMREGDYILAVKSALEKQIPKKVTVRKIGYKLLDYICPCCTYKQISQCGGEWVAGQKYKYCSHCGQALDWSDSE